MNFTALRCGSGVAAFVSALGPLLSAGTVLHLLEYAGDLIQIILGQFFQGVLSSLTVNNRVPNPCAARAILQSPKACGW